MTTPVASQFLHGTNPVVWHVSHAGRNSGSSPSGSSSTSPLGLEISLASATSPASTRADAAQQTGGRRRRGVHFRVLVDCRALLPATKGAAHASLCIGPPVLFADCEPAREIRGLQEKAYSPVRRQQHGGTAYAPTTHSSVIGGVCCRQRREWSAGASGGSVARKFRPVRHAYNAPVRVVVKARKRALSIAPGAAECCRGGRLKLQLCIIA